MTTTTADDITFDSDEARAHYEHWRWATTHRHNLHHDTILPLPAWARRALHRSTR